METRKIWAKNISQIIKRLCMEANTTLGEDVFEAYKLALKDEDSSLGKDILNQLSACFSSGNS